jgi:hypothetical protein
MIANHLLDHPSPCSKIHNRSARQALTKAPQTTEVAVPLVPSPWMSFRPRLLRVKDLRSRRPEPRCSLTLGGRYTATCITSIYCTCAVRALVHIDGIADNARRGDWYIVCWYVQQRGHECGVNRLTERFQSCTTRGEEVAELPLYALLAEAYGQRQCSVSVAASCAVLARVMVRHIRWGLRMVGE